MLFTEILNQDGKFGRKFSEIKVQSSNVRNKLKFGKIFRKDLLCTKMSKRI